MIKIAVPDTEYYDEQTETFEYVKGCTLKLEHSLISISKWESKWKKPYLSEVSKSYEEKLDYIRCMTINNVDDSRVYSSIPISDIERIYKYINDPMTATTFNEKKKSPRSKQTVTSELIYYWMVYWGIPFEAEKWHINRLISLIRICNIKGQRPEKMSNREIMSQNHSLNKARRAKFHTRG